MESPVESWWCRVDSNHRQHDYESCALPPELRHRRRELYRAGVVWARAFSLRFFLRCFATATRFLLFIASAHALTPGAGGLVAEVGFEPTTFGL